MWCNLNLAGLLAVIYTISINDFSAANIALYEDDVHTANYSDDNYGYDDDKDEVPQLISKIYVATSTVPATAHFYDMPRIKYKCPFECFCSKEFKEVDCSNRNLTKIPIIIPCVALRINLSSNLIQDVKKDDFQECYGAQEIILHNNKIQRIDYKVFANLMELKSIDLGENSLTNLIPDMFAHAQNLKSINLSYNNIKFREGSFLNSPKLEKLKLQSCNLKRLHDNFFQNLSGLLYLDLEKNQLEAFNVKAFSPLVELQELKLPNISKYNVQELCTVLDSVDFVSFGEQNISCFIFVSGGSFKESIIQSSQKTESTVGIKTSKAYDFGFTEHETTIISTLGAGQYYTVSKITDTPTTSEGYSSSTTRNESRSTSSRLHESISASAINKILIGIIVFAAFGLTIGIIRRKNACCLRNKLCRTRRPTSADLIQPAEAAPLNKL